MDRESKDYSWKCVTADELLSKMPCEFVYAKLTPAETDASWEAYATLYDGENILGKKIVKLHTGGLYNQHCAPPVPIYCRRGLYITVSAVDGVLVQWRELGQGEGS